MKKKADAPFDLALQYLSYRSRTEVEVRAYLKKKGLEPDSIAKIIAKLIYYHYIDDEQYMRTAVSSNYNSSQYGRRRLKTDLQHRGIQEDLLSQLDVIFTDSMEEACLKNQVLKACRRYEDEPFIKRKQKISAYLQRRGFAYSSIAAMMNKHLLNQENDDLKKEASLEDLKHHCEKYYRLYSRKGFEGRELQMRVCRGLLSRGFSYDDVQQAISNIKINIEDTKQEC